MSIAHVEVTIKGMSPGLLMHNYPMVPINGIEKLPPDEQAEYSAYRDDATGKLYIPGTAVQRALVAGAAYSKGKGRASLQKQVAACLFVNPHIIDLGIKEYVLDARPVVIRATKGRIVRYRPRIPEWEASFEIEYDEVLLKEGEIRQIVDDTGLRVGLLDFRPACKGPFGRFVVTHWKLIRAKDLKIA